jgi:hypothetical protein
MSNHPAANLSAVPVINPCAAGLWIDRIRYRVILNTNITWLDVIFEMFWVKAQMRNPPQV